MIDPAKEDQSTYLKDLEAQIAEQRARKLQEKKEQQADWWEKKTDPAYSLPSPKKPHPSMVIINIQYILVQKIVNFYLIYIKKFFKIY